MKHLALALAGLLLSTQAPCQTPKALPLYKEGMIVRGVIGPEGDDGYRLISLGLYSYRTADGAIAHKIGIQDITDPNDIYGKNFPLCEGPERRVFPLKTGGRIYALTVTSCGAGIKFGRAGNEDQIQTSRDRLFIMRAQNALDHGSRVTLGSSEFVVIFQGGNDSPGLVFFPAGMQRAIDTNDIAGLRPVFFVQTLQAGPNGDWVRKEGPLPVGSWKGRSFELVWNSYYERWSVQEEGTN